ncbi:MAG: adenine phosphoribosyltransferase [Thaumarchaeota archaeon]|nr:adenine phosphoribosyltransferase [Nitrososphaerota archaeon]
MIKNYIRNVPDFPKKGIMFRDITTLIKDPKLFRGIIDDLFEHYRKMDITDVLGIDARGFIIGAPLAYKMGVGFLPARKIGKLPAKKIQESYQLEYGDEGIEVHEDAISKDRKILIVDDLLATGGTALAAAKLVERLNGMIVGFTFLVELSYLGGREKLAGYDILSLCKYSSE